MGWWADGPNNGSVRRHTHTDLSSVIRTTGLCLPPHSAVCLVHANNYDVIHFETYTVNRECLLINIVICAWKRVVKVKHFSATTRVSIAPSLSTVGNRAFPITSARLWNSHLSDVTTAPFLSNFRSLKFSPLFYFLSQFHIRQCLAVGNPTGKISLLLSGTRRQI